MSPFRRLRDPLFFLAILVLAAPSAAQEPAKELTLADCYRLALKQSEEIALRQERIAETEGRFMRSLSSVLPKVSFVSLDKRQDGAGESAFTRKKLPERRFAFSQPLFSGFKELAAIKGARLERRQKEEEKARAEQLLLVDVSDAYHLLLEERREVSVLDSIRRILRDRIRELEGRERIGRSRPSERMAAYAQLYRVEAEWEAAQSRERVAAQLLEFLTGLPSIGELNDPGPWFAAPSPEAAYLERAFLRPDVKAAREGVDISRQQLKVAQAEFFPSVAGEGSYFVERSGAAQDVKWDASLKVDVPLFQGGAAAGAAKEAASWLRQAEIRAAQARRRSAQEIKDACAQYDAAVARVRALTEAVEAAETSYRLQAEEYRLSLVSNLEVLSSLEAFQEVRRDLARALYEAHRLYWRMKAAAGDSIA